MPRPRFAPPPAEAAAGALPGRDALSPRRLQPSSARRARAIRRRPHPRPGLAPPPPFVDAGPAGTVGCAAAAPGPGSEAPGGEEAARLGPGPRARRRPAEGLRRPRPARPSRALDRSVPVAGEGFSPGGVPRPALVALDTGHRPPVPLPARAYSAARPCQPAILALPAPGRCPAPTPSSGTLPAPHFPGSRCVTFGVPDASVCPRTPPTHPGLGPPGRCFTGDGRSA
ncbi:hypothetical protein J1605_001118 [Eschrichtius robustus]|uniref:Basic proline-rich protein-like n=1 Tax=Eschrichtius robustus TaxID=9764 RepID=A0AB34GR15_ESCRO|nr:hypothetical protein J1605_001118 [Eschrichtius robustus]